MAAGDIQTPIADRSQLLRFAYPSVSTINRNMIQVGQSFSATLLPATTLTGVQIAISILGGSAAMRAAVALNYTAPTVTEGISVNQDLLVINGIAETFGFQKPKMKFSGLAASLPNRVVDIYTMQPNAKLARQTKLLSEFASSGDFNTSVIETNPGQPSNSPGPFDIASDVALVFNFALATTTPLLVTILVTGFGY